MKKNRILFIIPSLLFMVLFSAFPIFKILVNIKKIEKSYLSIGSIIYLFLIIVTSLVLLVEIVYLLGFLYKSELSIFKKILWTILLLVFNIFIIPYFYMKYVVKYNKVLVPTLIYLFAMAILLAVFFFGANTYKKDLEKQKIERKKIEDEINVYSTKDGIVSFSFKHGYKISEVGEYDLYVKNDEKNIILSAFTYNTDKYEQKSPDDYINKAVSDISSGKVSFDKLKDKETITEDNKTINTVEYVGKTDKSSLCVYKISTINYSGKDNFIVTVIEIVTKKNYEKYIREMTEILKSSKIN
ncbi:MAG: hypothetical protein IKE73_01080 [Bacilli bacterium]|nr:hypothetical protein [Bacilli bacterium]